MHGTLRANSECRSGQTQAGGMALRQNGRGADDSSSGTDPDSDPDSDDEEMTRQIKAAEAEARAKVGPRGSFGATSPTT